MDYTKQSFVFMLLPGLLSCIGRAEQLNRTPYPSQFKWQVSTNTLLWLVMPATASSNASNHNFTFFL